MAYSKLTFKFHNNYDRMITVIVEPWAEEFEVPPKSIISLDINFNKLGAMETEINKKYFVIWLWSGCRAKVSLDGKELPAGALNIPAFG